MSENTALSTQVYLSDRLPVKIETLQDLHTLGSVLARSGFFKDVKDAGQAMVKIIAGAEIGLGPVASMTSIYIIESKPSFSSNLIASKIKSHHAYDYRVKQLDSDGCTVEILQRDDEDKFQPVGEYSFKKEDAMKAGLLGKKNWKTYPKAMYFSRAISQAARVYCPDVFHSVIPYTVEELAPDIEVTEHGDVVDVEAIAVEAAPVAEEEVVEAAVVKEEAVEEAAVEEAPAPKAPDGKPWMDPSLSIQDNRNILYAVAVAEWGYEDTDAVRETIIEANRWTGKPPIPDLKTLDEIATHLLEQSPDPEN